MPDFIDPLEFLRNFLERTMNATKLTASQEVALDYLESKALKNDPEAQAVAMMLRKKKYGHTLPTAFDMEV
jgi:ABC-type oligopeptide transport system substrate-binding subunit